MARPPGSHCGQRWELSPAAKSSVVSAPSACRPGRTRGRCRTCRSVRRQSRPTGPNWRRTRRGASASVAGVPPAMGAFLSFPPAKNPTHCPSGREERKTGALGAGERPRREIGQRSSIEPGAAAVSGDVGDELPVWRHRDRALVDARDVERHERCRLGKLDGEMAVGRRAGGIGQSRVAAAAVSAAPASAGQSHRTAGRRAACSRG